MTEYSPPIAELCSLHRRMYREGLVRSSSGNASFRHGDLIWIKASGVECAECRFEDMVCVGVDGSVALAEKKPSTDTAAHLYVYNHLPEIHAIIHTHSTYATSFAVAGLPIPCVYTAVADEFGCDIPVSEYCEIGNNAIGKEIVRLYEITKSPAMLIRQHGVFCVGKNLDATFKAAVMAEDCARVVWHAMQFKGIGGVRTILDAEKNHKRYTQECGQ